MENKQIIDQIFSSPEIQESLFNDERFGKMLDDFFTNFIFGSREEKEEFISYQDPRFVTNKKNQEQLKNQQIKSLFVELKEDKFKASWRNFIDSKVAFSLGNFDSYLTQAYQKHIHNLTKKFVNLENEKITFWVSIGCLLSETKEKFVDEHRENQYKVLSHISLNIERMGWKEFFDLMDEARKCNIVTSYENQKLSEFQLKSKVGEWKDDYYKAGVCVLNMCNTNEVLEFYKQYGEGERKTILENLKRLRSKGFSATGEILDNLISIISKEEKHLNG